MKKLMRIEVYEALPTEDQVVAKLLGIEVRELTALEKILNGLQHMQPATIEDIEQL